MAKIKADPQAWIRVIDQMNEKSTDYNYARDTLEGIRDYITEHGRVTAKQINAIQNIRRGADRL